MKMDECCVTVERLQSFLDVFYSNLNSRRRHYHYHSGNRAKTIESIELKKCYVIKELEKCQTEMLIIKYRNEDDIMCSFSILLEKFGDYVFVDGERYQKRSHKVNKLRLPVIKGRFAPPGERSEP